VAGQAPREFEPITDRLEAGHVRLDRLLAEISTGFTALAHSAAAQAAVRTDVTGLIHLLDTRSACDSSRPQHAKGYVGPCPAPSRAGDPAVGRRSRPARQLDFRKGRQYVHFFAVSTGPVLHGADQHDRDGQRDQGPAQRSRRR
jgi:hypothetical protein